MICNSPYVRTLILLFFSSCACVCRLGIYQEYYNHASPDVLRSCNAAIKGLTDRHARIVNVTVPNLNTLSKVRLCVYTMCM